MRVVAKEMSKEDMTKWLNHFDEFVSAFSEDLAENKARGVDPRHLRRLLLQHWDTFRNVGITLSQGILGTLEIPPGQERKLEFAVRAMGGLKRAPNDLVAWWDKNESFLQFLSNAAHTWPEKTEGQSSQIFKVGPFTVHNTLGTNAKGLQGVVDALERAGTLLKATPFPGAEKVLYGNVFIVGRLRQANTIAWYSINDDEVSIRPFKNASIDELQNLIHELGHRYHYKFVDAAAWAMWQRYHQRRPYTFGDVDMPEVGDTLEFNNVSGFKGFPTIQRIEKGPEGTRYYFTETKFFQYKQLWSILQGQNHQFPTLYARTNANEHFAEAFSLYVTGRLKEPFLSNFKSIFEKGEMPNRTDLPPTISTSVSASRVASRYMKARFFPRIFPDQSVDEAMEIKDHVDRFLELAIIPGHPDLTMSANELEKHTEGHVPNPFGFYSDYIITKPNHSAQMAHRDAEAEVSRYTQHGKAILQQAKTVMLIFWKDKNLWSGVVNYREIR